MKDIDYLKSLKILFVDDDENTREFFSERLKLWCNSVYTAKDGIDGYDKYLLFVPDIIITDISMPRMSGLEMIRKIKEKSPKVHFIITSAFENTEYFQEAIKLRVNRYIVKPINKNILKEQLLNIASINQLKQKALEQEKIILNQARVTAIGELLSNIAHQWRQPLSAINMNIANLEVDMDLNIDISLEELKSCASDIKNEVSYLSQTIDDFRGFFSDDISLKKSFNIKDSMNKLKSLIYDSFEANDIKLKFEIKDCLIEQNENQLIQAVLNICNNAKDAFIEKDIDTSERFMIVQLKEEGDKIILSFQDTAGGIDESIMDKIFEPYFTTKHQSIGTGIGLYMTNQVIIKQFNGTINVKNVSYQNNNKKLDGTKFILEIPFTAENNTKVEKSKLKQISPI